MDGVWKVYGWCMEGVEHVWAIMQLVPCVVFESLSRANLATVFERFKAFPRRI